MLFQKKNIQLTSANSINPIDIPKTETFIANQRKYRIFKHNDNIVIEREYLDFFDSVGIESIKQCATAKGWFHSSENVVITNLTTEIKKSVKNIYLISGLLLLISSLYFDVTYSSFITLVIIGLYLIIYLLLSNALTLFNEELTNDLNKIS